TLKRWCRRLEGVRGQQPTLGDVQTTDAGPDWGGKRSFDSDKKITNRVARIVRQPLVEGLKGLLAGEHFEPSHAAFAAISVLHCRVEHPQRRFPDVAPSAIALYEWNNRCVRHLQLAAAVADWLAFRGNRLPVI